MATDLQSQIRQLARPTTPQDLYVFLYLATGENIPSVHVCPDHSAPWDLIEAAFFGKYSKIIAIGPRGGSKTRSISKLITAELFYMDGVEIANVGAIEKQAKKCYTYVREFLTRSASPDQLLKLLRSETRLENGSMYEQLVGTVSGVNCLSGETLIDCPRNLKEFPAGIPIKYLVGKEFYTYSYDIAEDRFCLRKAKNVHKTGKLVPVYELAFEWKAKDKNGLTRVHTGSIVGTYEHPVLMKDGSYKQLGTLAVGERLQPFRAGGRNHRVVSVKFAGYEDVYDMEVEGTHNFIANGLVVHNSPHPHKLFVDEVELMRPEVLEELKMVPTSNRLKGITSGLVLTSTRKYQLGTVQGILDQKDSGFHPIIWCYKEVAENCGEERRGGRPKKHIIRDYHDLGDDGEPREKEILAWSNCGRCPLLPSCRGDLARAQGFYAIDDLINVFTSVTIETWIQQMECRKTNTTGRVYPTFDEAVHCGEYPYNPELSVDISLDFGFSNPAAVGFWQQNEDTDDVYLIDEIYESGLTTEMLARKIKEKLAGWRLTEDDLRYQVGDSEQAQQIADLKEYGLFIEPVNKGKISGGLNLVRLLLRGADRHVRLHISNVCSNTIDEMKWYHYKRGPDGRPTEEPVDKKNHSVAQMRYYAVYLSQGGSISGTIL